MLNMYYTKKKKKRSREKCCSESIPNPTYFAKYSAIKRGHVLNYFFSNLQTPTKQFFFLNPLFLGILILLEQFVLFEFENNFRKTLHVVLSTIPELFQGGNGNFNKGN